MVSFVLFTYVCACVCVCGLVDFVRFMNMPLLHPFDVRSNVILLADQNTEKIRTISLSVTAARAMCVCVCARKW